MKKILLASIYLLSVSLSAQFLKQSELSVIEDGIIIKNPLTGGLNSCQLSNIDLNNDGKQDIFVFERVGDRVLCFLNNNDGIGNDFDFSQEYSNNFPNLKKWAILIDFNYDGKEDIFTYNDSYVKVYKNTSQNENLSFEIEKQALVSDLGPIQSAIIISEVDIPSFVDVDGDQDIDILTFKQSGGYVEYHQNQSQEFYGNSDSLIFKLKTDCWGNFYEGLNTYDLNTCNEDAIFNPIQPRNSSMHSGSSSLAIDIDGDFDMDFILGDVSFNNLNLLINGGDSQNANMVFVNQQFPIGYGSIINAEINSFPAAFYVDINNDEAKDLVVSPNTENNSENFESIIVFLNTSENQNLSFEFSQNNFLQDNTLDFGSGAYPSTLDYNNDGLKDLIIGNYSYFNNSEPTSQLALLRNIGSQNEPNFEVIDRDFGGLSNIALDNILNTTVKGLFPTFGDLDNDGDIDMILGDSNGKIHYFKNDANLNQDAVFILENINFFDIDVGQHSAPFLYDINDDELFDLVIGQLDGSITYFENTGTADNPIFNTSIENFGGISVNNNESLYGFSTPFVYEENNEINILIGTESGSIYHYVSVNKNLSSNFELVSDNFQSIKEGKNTALLFDDFTNDGKRDMFLGMQSGGLFFFINDSISTNTDILNEKISVKTYPNPSSNIINISTDIESQITIYSSTGQLVLKKKVQGLSSIDISSLIPSFYLMHIQQSSFSEWRKIIKK